MAKEKQTSGEGQGTDNTNPKAKALRKALAGMLYGQLMEVLAGADAHTAENSKKSIKNTSQRLAKKFLKAVKRNQVLEAKKENKDNKKIKTQKVTVLEATIVEVPQA